jgi:hypothetical protein
MSRESSIRVSDPERERASASLAAHWEHGRLSVAELDQRLDLVLNATTRGELDKVFADLPVSDELSPRRVPRASRRLRLPGVRRFRRVVALREPPELAYEQALAFIAPMLDTGGFRIVVAQPPSILRFARQEGRSASVTMTFLPAQAGGTTLLAFGDAPRAVRSAFARLRDD